MIKRDNVVRRRQIRVAHPVCQCRDDGPPIVVPTAHVGTRRPAARFLEGLG